MVVFANYTNERFHTRQRAASTPRLDPENHRVDAYGPIVMLDTSASRSSIEGVKLSGDSAFN
jgi:hypothetical protein